MGEAPVDTLKRQFDLVEGRIHSLEFVRDSITNSTAEGPQVSRQIERLWAKDEAVRLGNTRRASEASQLAVGHQLVTPFSGAVVLETKQQYEQNNLKPANPETVPTIPEPSTWGLLIFGGAVLVWRFHRMRSI
jgi:hypothetical protein